MIQISDWLIFPVVILTYLKQEGVHKNCADSGFLFGRLGIHLSGTCGYFMQQNSSTYWRFEIFLFIPIAINFSTNRMAGTEHIVVTWELEEIPKISGQTADNFVLPPEDYQRRPHLHLLHLPMTGDSNAGVISLSIPIL